MKNFDPLVFGNRKLQHPTIEDKAVKGLITIFIHNKFAHSFFFKSGLRLNIKAVFPGIGITS